MRKSTASDPAAGVTRASNPKRIAASGGELPEAASQRDLIVLRTVPGSQEFPAWLERQDDFHRLPTPGLLLNVGDYVRAA